MTTKAEQGEDKQERLVETHVERLPYCPKCNEVSERADITQVGSGMECVFRCSACKGELLVYERTSRIIHEPYAI